MHVPLPDTDHKPQVRLDHLLTRLFVTGHHSLPELLLLLKREERRPTHLAKITLERI